MQKAEDDDLYTDITKSRKLARQQHAHDDSDEPAENTAKDKRNLLILLFSVLAIILIFVAILVFYTRKRRR